MLQKLCAIALICTLLVGCSKRRASVDDEDSPGTARTADTKTVPAKTAKLTETDTPKTRPVPVVRQNTPKKEAPPVEPKREPTRREMMLDATNHGLAINIYSEYEENGVAADFKFKGKTCCVVGLVQSIDTDILGRGMVQLLAGNTPLNVVTCYFDKQHNGELVNLRGAYFVVLVGTGKGKLLGQVLFEHCRIIDFNPDVEALNGSIKQLKDGK
jgi:hypothetical protein